MISRFRFPLRVQINSKFTRIYFPAEQVTIWADWRTMWASDTECKKGHWPRKTLIIWPSDYLTATRLIEGFWRRSKYSHEWVVPNILKYSRPYLAGVCKLVQPYICAKWHKLVRPLSGFFWKRRLFFIPSLVVLYTQGRRVYDTCWAPIFEGLAGQHGLPYHTIPYHTIPYHSC